MLPSDTQLPLAVAFAQRLAERDNPPPPPPLSQTPDAVRARIGAWLEASHGVRDSRSQLGLSRMLLALMQHPEQSPQQLGHVAGLTQRPTGRATRRLQTLGLADWYRRSYYRYWRLTRAAEDALLLVVAGPAQP